MNKEMCNKHLSGESSGNGDGEALSMKTTRSLQAAHLCIMQAPI